MKKIIFLILFSLCGAVASAQSTPTSEDLQKQLQTLEQRISELETRINAVLDQNERLRKVAEFGKPITEYLDHEKGFSHKVLSIEGNAQTGDLVVTLRIEAINESETIQFSETHLIDLYGKAYNAHGVEIAGQPTIRRDLEKGVPVVAKLIFKEIPSETVSEIKLLQYEDIARLRSSKIQFKNLVVNWK